MDNKKIFTNETIEIDKNVLKYGTEAIQIKNVSQVRVGTEPPKEYPAKYVIGLLFCIFCMLTFRKLMWILIIFFVVALFLAGFLYLIYQDNQNLSDYLIIELNSGSLRLFSCSGSRTFLEKAMDEMVEAFNDRSSQITISFSDCEITNSNIGDHGNVNSSYYK